MGYRIEHGINLINALEEVVPKFRLKEPMRISQVMGEERNRVFKGVLGTKWHEHNPRGKRKHGILKD